MPSFSTMQLQKMQSDYDAKYWNHDGFSTFENIRHLTLHVGKLAGKLSAYCEAKEHARDYSEDQITEEVIPDLLGYALQLSNWLDQDLSNLYANRLKANEQRFEKKAHVDNT